MGAFNNFFIKICSACFTSILTVYFAWIFLLFALQWLTYIVQIGYGI